MAINEKRRAAILALMTGYAERAERVPVMADIGAMLGVPNREARRQLAMLAKDGALIVERRGEGMAQSLRVILPGGVLASAWSPIWEPKGDSRTGTRRVLGLISDAARGGRGVPCNADMADQLGISGGLVQSILSNLAADGRIIVHREGSVHDGRRQFEVSGKRTAWSPRSRAPQMRAPRAEPVVNLGSEPPVRADLLVTRTRCPMCELPPGHADCRHRWNGLTTRTQRNMIAASAGLYGKGMRI